MSGISSLGTGSGLPLSDLLSNLVSAERQRYSLRLDRKESTAQTQISALGAFKSALADFRNSVTSLSKQENFELKSVSVSDSEFLRVQADEGAELGTYNFEVQQTAKSQQLVSTNGVVDAGNSPVDATGDIGGGTLSITVGTESFDVEIADDESSLNEIRDAINNDSANKGVTATVLNVDGGAKLVLTANGVGSDNAISVTVDDNDGLDTDGTGLSQLDSATNLTVEQTADDAELLINGQLVTNTGSNDFDDVIDGLSITALEETTESQSFTVEQNTGRVVGMVTSFVSAYNEFRNLVDGLSSFNPETGERGIFLGDSLVRGIDTQLRRVLTSPVGALDAGSRLLSNIGVGFDDQGKLELDTQKLNDALDASSGDVATLFTDSSDGIATALDRLLEGALNTGGTIDARLDGLNARVEDLGNIRQQEELRLQAFESRLLSKFSALDGLVSQLSNTQNFLAGQLAGLQKLAQSTPPGGG